MTSGTNAQSDACACIASQFDPSTVFHCLFRNYQRARRNPAEFKRNLILTWGPADDKDRNVEGDAFAEIY